MFALQTSSKVYRPVLFCVESSRRHPVEYLISIQNTLAKQQEEKNLLLAQSADSAVDCTDLKKALLSAKEVDGFLCLSGSEVFPASLKETTNEIPSKLLIRSFLKEIKLILQKLRSDRKVKRTTGGAIRAGLMGLFLSMS
eukprot:gene29572-35697_t